MQLYCYLWQLRPVFNARPSSPKKKKKKAKAGMQGCWTRAGLGAKKRGTYLSTAGFMGPTVTGTGTGYQMAQPWNLNAPLRGDGLERGPVQDDQEGEK